MSALFRQQNIEALASAIQGDLYNDEQQIEAWGDDTPETIDFLNRNLNDASTRGGPPIWLELGCGSGRLLNKLLCNPTWMVDPSEDMCQRLAARIQRLALTDNIPKVIAGFAEAIPDAILPGSVEAVVFMNGFFQVRSDYEALIEINRVLCLGGRFLFNLVDDDSEDLICGRVLGTLNYIRVAEEFGFRLVERRNSGHLALEKEHDFYPEKLRKLQLKKAPALDGQKPTYYALNLDARRDRKFT